MQIVDFPNYQVFEDGTVIGARGKVLKEDTNSTGYKRVSLCRDGKVSRVFVHRLVACHFLDKTTDNLVVNHIDGDRANNHVTNLEWVTNSYNVKDGFARGRKTEHLHLNFGR
jgi:hypothetical protein